MGNFFICYQSVPLLIMCMQSYEKGLSQEGKGSIFGIFFGDLGLFDYFCALKRMEHMRKLIPFLLAGGIVLCAASCKEEKKTED